MNPEQVEPVAVEGRIRIPYRWPAGRAAGTFLSLLAAEGRLVGLRCPTCRRVAVPPTARCNSCRAACEEQVPVGPGGSVTTWTLSRRTSPPQILALVRLDGADTALLHRLIGLKPEDVRSGMRVEAVFEKDRRGSILDLAGFRPAPAEPPSASAGKPAGGAR
ncbi:MAG: OB-fold domain-containing protein [Planctomycetes bacterium]|nr:OB-fold domain-containing protein [Planctomycetota bacterium]